MSQKKQRRKDNTFRFPFSRVPTLFSPARLPSGPSRATRDTPDKSRKEISRHKGSLCNAVKLHWFSFFLFFLRILDRQHKIVALCHAKEGLGDHAGFAFAAQFSGRNVVLDQAVCRDLSDLLAQGFLLFFSAESSVRPHSRFTSNFLVSFD